MSEIYREILLLAAVVLAVLLFAALIRAVLGPRFTDRIVAVNMMNTMVVGILCLLSAYLDENYLVDVALAYALLSFLTVVVLAGLVRRRRSRRREETGEVTGDDP